MTRSPGRPPLRVPGQLSLLDWEPPRAVRSFEPARVTAPTMAGRISRAVSAALEETDLSRAEIAAAMSASLGATVSLHMLNAYASQARETHAISAPRYLALAQATGDGRLVELLAAPLGLAAIERRYLAHIELAAVHERREELRRHGETLRRLSKFRSNFSR